MKEFVKVAQSINKRITENYDGDISSLIISCFEENEMNLEGDIPDIASKKIIGSHTKYKMELIDEKCNNIVDQKITTENFDTRKRLKQFLKEAIEQSLSKKEKIDLKEIQNYLEELFSKKDDEGQPLFSPHITDHMNELIEMAKELSDSTEYGEILNKTVVDVLKEESSKMRKGWIRNLLSISDLPEKLTVDQFNDLNDKLYGEDSRFEIETRMVIGVRDPSQEGLENAFKLLAQRGVESVLTFEKAEVMFGGLSEPYSEELRKFFLSHKDEFIANPSYYKYLSRLNTEFDTIIKDPLRSNRYLKGTVTVQEVIDELQNRSFNGIGEGEHELAFFGRKFSWTQEEFDRAKEILKQMKEREVQTIPPISKQKGRFRGRILRIDDPLAIGIGDATTCCQCLDAEMMGESSMMHSVTEKNGAVFVVEEIDELGKVIALVAQSWVWRNGDRLCFDNIEIPDDLQPRLKREETFDDILDIYQESAQRMSEKDTEALRKLLKAGIITKEQFDEMQISEITAGTGCDDLFKNISNERRTMLEREKSIILPVEDGQYYTGMFTRKLYSDARKTQLIIAKNDGKAPVEHKKMNVHEYGLQYSKIREVIRREESDINPDIVQMIKELNDQEGREIELLTEIESLNFSGIQSFLKDKHDVESFKTSISFSENADWYILKSEDEENVYIEDSLIGSHFDPNNPKSVLDKKMSFNEYSKELLTIIAKADKAQKKVQLDIDREGKLGILKTMVEKGILSIEDGTVSVQNAELLLKSIEKLDEELDKQASERMLSDIAYSKDEPDEK